MANCCNGKLCKICGVVTLQCLLLVWSIGAVLFSALTVGTCEFLTVSADALPYNATADPGERDSLPPTGQIGLFQIEVGDDAGYKVCNEMPGYVIDAFGTYFQIGQLMGVVALTTGGVAAIVLIVTFLMEMCCSVAGLQYGLGIMFMIACITQGLTFMAIGDDACKSLNCSISASGIWSIVAIALYFIAMIQSFVAPFPTEKICDKETCCSCCQKKEKEGGDVEAQQKSAAVPEEDSDAAKAAAAGVAAAGAGAAVVAAADDDQDKEEEETEDKLLDEEMPVPDDDAAAAAAAAAGVGGAAAVAAAADNDQDEEAVDMTVLDEDNKALDKEEEKIAATAAAAAEEGGGDGGDDEPEPKKSSLKSSIFKSAKSIMSGSTKAAKEE